MDVACFWLEPTERVLRSLRRYQSHARGDAIECPIHRRHDTEVEIDAVTRPSDASGHDRQYETDWQDFPLDDPRWPAVCECGYEFQEDDEWQVFTARLYRRVDNGEEYTILHGPRMAPAGAMWDARWYWRKGPDGRCLMVRLPNGNDWIIDSRASNCTMPDDNEHYCWVRHGEVPRITVDKNGFTCQAGAGSILSGDWHGFLRDGMLVP